MDFFQAVEEALATKDVEAKRACVEALPLRPDTAAVDRVEDVMRGHDVPGRPQRPELVHPAAVPRRRLQSKQGRLALVHAVAHIEFNAINLALDAAWRFRGMPVAYYEDWLRVARDESRHFGWLQARLEEMGARYGDLPAHDGLWEAAMKTAHDPLLRMALVPRVLEARGLDVTPGMIKRLKAVEDHQTVAILERILAEEVAHVDIGSRWYRHLCERRGEDADALFPELLSRYLPSLPRPPFNLMARRAAGFSSQEVAWLQTI